MEGWGWTALICCRSKMALAQSRIGLRIIRWLGGLIRISKCKPNISTFYLCLYRVLFISGLFNFELVFFVAVACVCVYGTFLIIWNFCNQSFKIFWNFLSDRVYTYVGLKRPYHWIFSVETGLSNLLKNAFFDQIWPTLKDFNLFHFS